MLDAAAGAADAQAAVLEKPAAKVLLDLAHDEARQPARLIGALEEGQPVRVDGAVEHRILGAMPLERAATRRSVQRGVLGHGRTP